jgi:bacterial/archaeal transporter family protein
MVDLSGAWWVYALLSAGFAALTTLFAKIGVTGVDSNLATAIRTAVIVVLAWAIVLGTGATAGIKSIPMRTWIFLILSAFATGASWIFYFRALQLGKASWVAPVDKLSLVLVVVLAAVFLNEPITWKSALGAGLIVAGTLVFVL